MDLSKFDIIGKIGDEGAGYFKKNEPILAGVVKKYHHHMLAIMEEIKRENPNSTEMQEIRSLEAEISDLRKNLGKLNSENAKKIATAEAAAKKMVEVAQQTADKKYSEAEAVLKESKKKAVELERAAEIKAKSVMESERQSQEKDRKALEAAKAEVFEELRTQRQDAQQQKKALLSQAEAQAKELKHNAEANSSKAVNAARDEVRELLATAQAEAEATRKSLKDNADKLALDAVVHRMAGLAEQGGVLTVADRATLRQLYRSAGEILTRSQGHEMPADPSMDRSLDTLDQIEMLYDTLATKIKGIEAKDWPDQVKEMAIQSLMAKVDVKAGALTNEDLEED